MRQCTVCTAYCEYSRRVLRADLHDEQLAEGEAVEAVREHLRQDLARVLELILQSKAHICAGTAPQLRRNSRRDCAQSQVLAGFAVDMGAGAAWIFRVLKRMSGACQ